MRETDIYALEVAYLPGVFTRIENSISSGIFDVHLAGYGQTNWIENKVRHGNQIKVRGSQYVWGSRQLQHGMKNLWFLAMLDEEDVPAIYPASVIIAKCLPSVTDKKGHMLVNVAKLVAPRGWSNIRTVLYPP